VATIIEALRLEVLLVASCWTAVATSIYQIIICFRDDIVAQHMLLEHFANEVNQDGMVSETSRCLIARFHEVRIMID